MKNLKRCLALLLVLGMLAGILPAAVSAEEAPAQTTELTAMELSGVSRLDNLSGGETAAEAAPYADDEMVTVIVLMEDPAVMEYFGISTYNEASAELTAGEAVSEFLASDGAQALSQELLATQQDVIAEIEAITEEAPAQDETQVVAQWTGLINGMAVSVPYGRLAEIQALPGVASAYVEQTFDAPEEPVSDAGTAGYSYDLVGVDSVWAEGYYGEGMVVAVLDTGLDLEYTSWGDSDSISTGVRRVHEAFSEDSFRTEAGYENTRYTAESMEALLATTQLVANTGSEGQLVVFDGNALYKNRKVPFAYDYYSMDVNVRPEDGDHGTHVAGTVAGYCESDEGEVVFSGVAPDAQILAMKVFDDYGSSGGETAILCALEDAAALGADVINLSLGSDNGFAVENTAGYFAYQRLRESGVLFMISAGNSGASSAYNNRGDYNLSSDPETSMISTPSTYGSVLSIASMDNVVAAQSMLTWTDSDGTATSVAFQDPYDVAMKYTFAGQEVNIIPVDGAGTYQDYYNAGFRSYYGYTDKGCTGIALIQRGGVNESGEAMSFEEKINNALSFYWSYYDSAKGQNVSTYPVKGVIIYDSDPESTDLIYMSVSGALITSCFISGKDGAALFEAAKTAIANGTYVTAHVEQEDEIVASKTAGEISSFTSWGATPGLELKPDITAPGGDIWSSLPDSSYVAGSGVYDDYTGTYGMMSGTSMAAPHMTGITALVKQYAKQTLGITGTAAADLTEQLLVSTAQPMSDGNTYYSPRVQGAGLVNASAAISTPAYISVEGMDVGKLELKDDPEKTGSYTLTFQVNNLTEEVLTYQATASVLWPDTSTDEQGNIYMLDSDVLIKEVDLGTVTVPAGGSVAVTGTVELTDAEKAAIEALFPNGTYIEGFVVLTSETEPQLGLPFLAFYGDWTSAPIFDSAVWTDVEWDTENLEWVADTTWGVSMMACYDAESMGIYNLGQNPFDSFAYQHQTRFLEENITVSPNGMFKSINNADLYQLRDSQVIVVEVKDKETGELYYRDSVSYLTKSVYDYTYGVAIPWSSYFFTETAWAGTDLEGNILPSGTQCEYIITAYGIGEYDTVVEDGYEILDLSGVIPGENEPTFNGHAMDMTGDVISFDVMVDTVAPKLVNSTVTTYVEDGRTYITGTFQDEGSIASIEIVPQVKRTYNLAYNPSADASYAEYGLDDNNPFYTEMIYDADVQEWTFIADVTEYVHANESYTNENRYYNFEWTGNIYIFGGDYGGNDRAYGVTVTTGDGLILSTTSAKLYVGDSFDLNVIDNTGSGAPLTRTSTHPEVATVDEFGHIVAVAPGQTEIVISNGTEEVVCIVAVEDIKTEVIDFDLSLEYFEGLKPGGSIVVKVTNLEPADAIITENIWSVEEDDPDLYAGLINCAKYSVDGMSAELYLNYEVNTDMLVPGASGTLTVSLNGVSRTLKLDWEDLYTSQYQDDMISELDYGQQTVYVEMGESAELVACYRNSSNHLQCNVGLYTLENYENYSYDNTTDPAVGLVLDGPLTCGPNSTWSGKIVNEEGYALPEYIRVFTRYSYGYEYELTNSWHTDYTYDPTTGEINVYYTPSTNTATLVIRADGVESEGNPAGEMSGVEYEVPDGLYGPFDWTLTSGTGTLTTGSHADYYGEEIFDATYTPSEPGVSYITATSRDGEYSVNYAVICTGVQAEKLDIPEHKLTLYVGDTYQLQPVLTPTPTLDIDKRLTYTSFKEDVVTVDENGLLTAVAEGDAYVCIEVTSGVDVETYCIVHVLPCMDHTYGDWTTTVAPGCETAGEESHSCTKCGYTESRAVAPTGHELGEWTVTTAPTCISEGEETRVCVHCGGAAETRPVALLNHSFTDWTVTKEATCEEEGEQTRSCTHCGGTETQTIPALGHSYGQWETTVEPGCESEGTQQRTCAHCGDAETQQLPAAGHSYTHVVTKPTGTEQGYTTHTCENCGHSYVDSYTAPSTNAPTGDGFSGLWLALLALSMGAMAVLAVELKKKRA